MIDLKQVPKKLSVVVRTPDKVVFEGECEAVVASNIMGEFAVCPGHENFITNINGKITIHTQINKKTQDIPVQVGVLRVKLNVVNLYIIL